MIHLMEMNPRYYAREKRCYWSQLCHLNQENFVVGTLTRWLAKMVIGIARLMKNETLERRHLKFAGDDQPVAAAAVVAVSAADDYYYY